MATFDYAAPAELFASTSSRPGRAPVKYYRFDTAGAAIRFAIEELPVELLKGAILEANEDRFDCGQIRELYAKA